MRALGIDVGVRKGLDLVLLADGAGEPAATYRSVPVDSLGPLMEEARPDVVAIDSPPGWASTGRSRGTEREIRVFGIQSYGTPNADRGDHHPFYEWMQVGFEVFPHASAVVLAGCLPPRGSRKAAWRASVLRAAGVPVDGLRSPDLIDAALAALTGLRALAGRSCALGDPREGVIVLPARTMPARPYRRCAEPAVPRRQPHLPRMSPCACGDPSCERLTSREFAPGHDARRKYMLWALARQGHEAAEELRRRGWELPPEMR